MKNYEFRLRFPSDLFLWVQYSSIDLDNGLAQNKRQAVIWTNADQMH